MFRLPIVNLSDASGKDGRFEFDQAVSKSLKGTGFLGVVGHGITVGMLQHARKYAARVFSQDPEYLEERYGRPALFRQRGFTPMWSEQAVGYPTPDAKMFWMTRLDEVPEDLTDNPFGDNVWPQEEREFRHITLALMHASVECGRRVLVGLARGRGFEWDKLVEMTFGSETVLRTIYYPPSTADFPADAMRSAPHEDINLITVLPGVEPGLELYLGGEWHEVVIDPSVVLVNIGEMIAEIDGFRDLVPTKHRVRAPSGIARSEPRFAFPTFMHARRSVELRPGLLEGTWLDERIAAITKR